MGHGLAVWTPRRCGGRRVLNHGIGSSRPGGGTPQGYRRFSSVRPGTILVICAGNVCRSPYLERRLAQELEGASVHRCLERRHSELVGRDMDPGSEGLLERAGAWSEGFVARRLTAELVAGADLVITAAREHRTAAAQLHPRALRRVFTLCGTSLTCSTALTSPGPNRLTPTRRGCVTWRGCGHAPGSRGGASTTSTSLTPIGRLRCCRWRPISRRRCLRWSPRCVVALPAHLITPGSERRRSRRVNPPRA